MRGLRGGTFPYTVGCKGTHAPELVWLVVVIRCSGLCRGGWRVVQMRDNSFHHLLFTFKTSAVTYPLLEVLTIIGMSSIPYYINTIHFLYWMNRFHSVTFLCLNKITTFRTKPGSSFVNSYFSTTFGAFHSVAFLLIGVRNKLLLVPLIGMVSILLCCIGGEHFMQNWSFLYLFLLYGGTGLWQTQHWLFI